MHEQQGRLSIEYNKQFSVEYSDKVLTVDFNKDAVLKSLGAIIGNYDMNDYIGVRLLHKHNNISSESMMIEEREILSNSVEALTTSRKKIKDINIKILPSVWRICGDGPFALEFADSKLFPEISETDFIPDKFVKDFSAEVIGQGLENIIGFCLLNKSLKYDKNVSTLSESIEIKRCANVVIVKDKSLIRPESHVETTWEFTKTTNTDCARNCCNNCVSRSPGHDIGHKHHFHAMDD